jgi:hypothetical protein
MVKELKPSKTKPKLASLCFVTLLRSSEASQRLRLLIDSLHAFGGQFSQLPVWIFWGSDFKPIDLMREYSTKGNIAWIPLADKDRLPRYYFAHKISACAQAEEMATKEVRSLVWLDPNCLVIQPPVLLDLVPEYETAFRPVHIQNVGSLASEPMDNFWETIYRTIGVEDAPFKVQSFVDSKSLRPYFNTHLFSIDPSKGMLRLWLEYFKVLVADQPFQSGACSSELHQIFLHQAILSTLVAKLLPLEHIRILPPEYSYPLHLHHKLLPSQRAGTLNDLVCAVYEEDLPHPQVIRELEIREPLTSWLLQELSTI